MTLIHECSYKNKLGYYILRLLGLFCARARMERRNSERHSGINEPQEYGQVSGFLCGFHLA